MSRIAHRVETAEARLARHESDFAHARYVAVPAGLWVAAMLAALVATALQSPAADLAQPAAPVDSAYVGA
jgi:hypothetical protein